MNFARSLAPGLSRKDRIKVYFKEDFKHDLISGIVVGLVALPLAIAFAIASGVKAEQGLYTAIIGGALMAILSGSNYQVSGPTGAFIVILLGIVNKFGVNGLMVAGFMAGIMLLVAGLLKFGDVIKFFPYPVIVGFTAGIGVIIFSGEIKDFFGLSFPHRPENFLETMRFVGEGVAKGINIYSVLIGAITLAAFLLWKRFNKKMPPAPIALAVGIIASLFFQGKLPTIGTIPSGLPSFHMLDLSLSNIKLLLPSAFTIFMLGAIESLLSAVVADGMTGTKHNSNKELISQGIGNMVVPFFGGIAATGAIARTATNIKNGARTRWSGVIHAITLLLIVLVFSGYAKFIPMAALAAILMMVAYNMAEIPHFIELFKAPKSDIFVLLATFVLTVFVDLTVAVGSGLALAALLFIKRVSEINVTSLEEGSKIGSEGSKQLHASVMDFPQIQLYEISGPMFFGAASILQDRLNHRENEILILRMKHVPVIDATAIHALEIIIDRAHKNGGKVILANLRPHVRNALEKKGLIKKLGGADYVTETSTGAVHLAKKIIAK